MAGSLRVLIVDDDPTCRRVAVEALSRLGYDARTASGGREALDLLGRMRVDLVLMDCQMPDLDGLEATRELRQRDNPVPIVAYTTLDGAGDRARCRAAGMDDFLRKPLRHAELRAVLGRWLAGAAPASGAG